MSAAGSTVEFEALLEYLRQTRGFDFSGYKRSSLMRRLAKRMQMVNIEGFGEYQDYLEVHPEEFGHLFNMILINVTAFFRDAPAWEYLGAEIIPRIVAGKKPYEPIRVWSAACASGEEAYSLAILFAETLGLDAARERVKIYATDVDEDALAVARHGAYTARDVAAVPPALVEKYFEGIAGRFVFHRDLRRSVIFGRHDLLQDAPISRVDLLVCRNSLMYFNAETQARLLARFHFALNDSGYLFLGKAEMLLTQSNVFVPMDLKRRVFVKVAKSNVRDRLLMLAQAAGYPPQVGGGEMINPIVNHIRLREAAFDAGPVAQIAVDASGALALANERARTLFDLTPHDMGHPLQDLDLSYRPVELRRSIAQAIADRRAVCLKEVEWPTSDGAPRYLDIDVVPLPDPGAVLNGGLIGVSITYTDVTRSRQLQAELQHTNQELETAYEELQSTNEELETTNQELHSTVEELETTNEELQSTNEELETMNEELQSTNEELETMNEELQSTNEELQTMNEELRQRSAEVNEANAFLEAILTSLQRAVVVTDRDLYVRVWSPKAEDLWGLRPDEAKGKHLLNLDIGLPVDQLRQPIRACLAGHGDHHEMTVSATNRRGRMIECRIVCSPLRGPQRDIDGAILLIEEVGGLRPS